MRIAPWGQRPSERSAPEPGGHPPAEPAPELAPDATSRVSPDVLVIGFQEGSASGAASLEALLGEALTPRRVIGISLDGRRLRLSELRPATAALGSLSPAELLELIRGGRRRAAGAAERAFNPGA